MICSGYKIGLSLLAAAALLGTGACGANTAQMEQPNQPGQSIQQKLSAQKDTSSTPHLLAGKEDTERANKPLTLADLHHKYRSTFLFNGPRSLRQAALTFDDVPDTTFTVQILDILKSYGVKATFFVVGNRAAAHPEIVRRIHDEGHIIGSHSYTHPNLSKTSDANFRDEIQRTEEVLSSITGSKPKLFRPPYGNVTEPQILWLASQKYHIINWNVDSLDWKGLNADQVADNVLGHVVPGAVILQHGAGGEGENLAGTVQALPRIIEKLQEAHIELVTIPQLFHISDSVKVDSPIPE
ncbi:Peptidoglycan/xylan/chitin deacetylase, PgdA/CDA1 family [Paenibacillus sp. 1_12]|uniref:polysaccharide deacetylase family protein n=1 Tax=Paenibacillus sp. 1_12 TaxID=1566278 RepID=UPI0008EDD0D0|nr:polysaccharide deacetylase family protein [Paenibacillus sp. 1_12]SFL81563.1 Peptidoglycan/xylan/chitin deacetylase, PgdA/CDA1 family [Paenibacillus sp. 1_12]